jgi:hypothetical protein
MTHERSQLGSGFERFEEAFRQAAEKDRLAACAPQTKQIHLRLIGAPQDSSKILLAFAIRA